jgi:hypothetical protein
VGGALLIALGDPVAAKPGATVWIAPGMGGLSAGACSEPWRLENESRGAAHAGGSDGYIGSTGGG